MVEVADVTFSSTVGLLEHFHNALDCQFSDLRDARANLEPRSPVFVLEHDLSRSDLERLNNAVRDAIRRNNLTQYKTTWLPFLVYAAEMGYGYEGDEYWTTFSSLTPRWTNQERSTIRDWFRRFHERYGGARPSGAWANHFTIISWPITHAVLPVYLQRNLAQLLFEFSGALTSELLDDPQALGIRLASRAANYTERFRVFCENVTLVGQVAAALLSGENEPTPYLTAPTLSRIVEGLSEEQQARHWLKSARASASHVRGFLPSESANRARTNVKKSPRSTAPRLFLRYEGAWTAYAELPNLTVLGAGFPAVYSQLRMSRASVNGGVRPIPPSALLYPGQEVRFAHWPRPDRPFLQLERGDDEINNLLSDQCAITKGPWWLFHRQGTGLAVEVKGKFVRPGHQYVLVGFGNLSDPDVPWCNETEISAEGAKAYEFTLPTHLSESEESVLVAAELVVISHVVIRPVGIVASAWDGEGEVEWLAGEPALLGIRSDLVPRRARVVIDEMVYFLEWTHGESELIFSLDGLTVGTHEVGVVLLGDGDRQLASGSLIVNILDPQVRPEGGGAGEGIRLLAAPARPTLAELWDDRAEVTVYGPVGTEADLRVVLRDGQGKLLTDISSTVRLPMVEADWRATAKCIRDDSRFSDAYDATETSTLTVARDGVGFASLISERGFQPLRWRFSRIRDGVVDASLVDRTDSGSTTVDFYDVDAPLIALPKDSAAPFTVPPRGGLVIATAGDAVASAILPTNPNELIRTPLHPVVTTQSSSVQEVLCLARGHQSWTGADLPADPFAAYVQQVVGDAIARSIGTIIGGGYWAAIERKLEGAQDAVDYLDEMRNAVGVSSEHKALASTVASRLDQWLEAEDLLRGFYEVITPYLIGRVFTGKPAAPRFLLLLAGQPGSITNWEPGEASNFLQGVLDRPVLFRATRFAVLGTRALNDRSGKERSF